MKKNEEIWVDTKEAAEYLGFKEVTLRKWRLHKVKLRFKNELGKIKYSLSDLEELKRVNTYIQEVENVQIKK
jgi:hypothetical protein